MLFSCQYLTNEPFKYEITLRQNNIWKFPNTNFYSVLMQNKAKTNEIYARAVQKGRRRVLWG